MNREERIREMIDAILGGDTIATPADEEVTIHKVGLTEWFAERAERRDHPLYPEHGRSIIKTSSVIPDVPSLIWDRMQAWKWVADYRLYLLELRNTGTVPDHMWGIDIHDRYDKACALLGAAIEDVGGAP